MLSYFAEHCVEAMTAERIHLPKFFINSSGVANALQATAQKQRQATAAWRIDALARLKNEVETKARSKNHGEEGQHTKIVEPGRSR